MGDPFVVALAALGLSLGVSAIRLIDWFIHSDPRAVLRIARLAPAGLAALSIVLLLVLMFNRQWTAAIGVAAAMVLVLAWYLPRLLRQPFRLLDPASANASQRAGQNDITVDRELVERSVAVLEAYLRQASPVALRAAGLQTVNGQGATRATATTQMSTPCPMRKRSRFSGSILERASLRSPRRIDGWYNCCIPIAAGRTT
jgi:hypothetical protein